MQSQDLFLHEFQPRPMLRVEENRMTISNMAKKTRTATGESAAWGCRMTSCAKSILAMPGMYWAFMREA